MIRGCQVGLVVAHVLDCLGRENRDAMVPESDVRDVGVDPWHVAAGARVGHGPRGHPGGFRLATVASLVTLQALGACQPVSRGGVFRAVRIVRVVAGDAREALVLLVTATGPQLVDVSDNGHLRAGTGQSVLDAFVGQRQSGPEITWSSPSDRHLDIGLQVTLLADCLGQRAFQSPGIDDREVGRLPADVTGCRVLRRVMGDVA